MPRCAIYYVPHADDPLYQLGTQILGYDVRARQMVSPSSEHEAFLGSDLLTWTTTCRPYGFHVTITEALDCHWATIPRVEQELRDVLGCFDPSRPFLLEASDDQPVGLWGEKTRASIVLRYEPNLSLRLFHTLLVSRIIPFGTSSDVLRRSLTEPQKDVPPHVAQRIRLFFNSAVFDDWYPHFTVLNPYTGVAPGDMASRLAQCFRPYKYISIETICLLIQEHEEANWQIYQEIHHSSGGR